MFTPVHARAAFAYRNVGVESRIDGASPHQLINMLFDGLMQSLSAARGAIARGDQAEKGRHLGKAVRILEEGLKGGLNAGDTGELSRNLRALYSYSVSRLTHANLRDDVAPIEEVVLLIEPVAQSWAAIGAASASSAAQPNVPGTGA